MLYTSSPSAFTYLHADHLGSVSVATDSSHAVVSQQEFDPWGQVRSGGVSQTNVNYTGQRLDGTGLLYYHARLYDPGLGRFVSADSIVPGAASGAGGGAATLGLDGSSQLKPLTVDFHETGYASKLNAENGLRFWFQMSDEERQEAGSLWGPANPQALNRYSYVLNNPIRYTDPTGHLGMTTRSYGTTYHLTHAEATALLNIVSTFAATIAGTVTSIIASGLPLSKVLPAALMSIPGVTLVDALLIQSAMAEIGTIGVNIGLVMTALGAFSLLLAGLDALYGYQGLDITLVNGVPAPPIITPPTVSRQQGLWYEDKKICDDFLCLHPV